VTGTAQTRTVVREYVARHLGLDLPDERLPAALNTWLGDGHEQSDAFVSAVTVSKSAFFRDPEQLEAIATRAERIYRAAGRHIRIWCAGCASGEEPYSLAMLLRDRGVPAEILGTDVDEVALEHARDADYYAARRLRRVSTGHRQRYFRPAEPGYFALRPPIRGSVRFESHNIAQDAPPPGPWDLVVCRNVFAYFRRDAVTPAVERILGELRRRGVLWVGAADGLDELDLPLERSSEGPGAWRLLGAERTATPMPIPPPDDGPVATVSELVERGLYAAAYEAAVAHCAANPGDAVGWVDRGNLELREHRFDDALASYARALLGDPGLAEAHYFRGVLYGKRGAWREAAAEHERALHTDPLLWPAHFLRAVALERVGADADADAAFQRVASAADGTVVFRSCAASVNSVHLAPGDAIAEARRRSTAPRRAAAAGTRGSPR